MIFGSVCSGIEAASVAWYPLGWRAAWLAEIEPFPCSVLAHHWPDVPNLGDMTTIADKVANDNVPAPDVLVGGTPCQAFSVAGMRGGLSDARGALSIAFVRLADAIDSTRNVRGEQPSIVVWENVPGVLSSKDNAFGCFLAGLAGESCELQPAGGRWTDAGCVYGPARTVAWRVLDAQYFGVAQRRRRVFVVASARTDVDPSEILFEFDCLRRDTAPSREAGQSAAGYVASSFGQYRADDCAGTTKASGGDLGGGSETFVVHGTQDPDVRVEQAHTLGRNSGQENAVLALAGNTIGRKPENGGNGNGWQEDLSYTLTSTDQHGVAYAVEPKKYFCRECGELFNDQYAIDVGELAAPECPRCGQEKDIDRVAYSFDSLSSNSMKSPNPHSGCREVDVSKTLDATRPDPSCNQGGIAILQSMAVRRLTPTECERLQGFPDGHTLVPHRGKDAADGPRYKALGNSMAVPVMSWIGRRISRALAANDNTPPGG